MCRTRVEKVQFSPKVRLEYWYDTSIRLWTGIYITTEGFQIGDAWYDHSRDYLLVNRPPTPADPETEG